MKAVFEEFGWAVHAVDQEHDWGTDLWVSPFDNERYSTASLIGVQVKTSRDMSGKYFKEAKKEGGEVTGWWFRPDKADHLEEWRRHSVPHIIAVCCLDTGEIYWERVSNETIVPTGKSGKVLICASKTLTSASRDDLLSVAAEGRRQAFWEGTAWESADTLTPRQRLRAAFICPRLVSPHPNRVSGPLDPAEAVAMLVQLRIDELDRTRSPASSPLVPEEPASQDDWRWRLYGALHSYLVTNDDPEVFDSIAQRTTTTEEAATITAVRTAALMEHGRAEEALSCLDLHLADEELQPLDRLWLGTQRAWSMYELGRTEEAVALASKLQVTASLYRPDPTAGALGASVADLIFASKRSLAAEDLAAVLNATDTAVDWWREQTLGRGGSARADADFKAWARVEGSHHENGAAWCALRSATLMAAIAANRNGWRRSNQRLAQEQLVRDEALSEDSARDSLQMLRLAGAIKEVEMVAHRLLQREPARYLRLAARDVDLDRSTTTSLTADIALLQKAGDVVDARTADRTLAWAVTALKDVDGFERRQRPMFLVAPKILGLVAAITPSLSEEGLEALCGYLSEISLQEDQLAARGHAKILNSLPANTWPGELVKRLGGRDGDACELADAIDRLVAARDRERRKALLSRIRDGDLAALHAYGDVRDLPTAVATDLAKHLISRVAEMVERAPGWTIGGPSPLHALALISVQHPEAAAWPSVVAALKRGAGSPTGLAETLKLLTDVAELVPAAYRGEITVAVRALSEMTPLMPLFNGADVASAAKDTLNVLEPGASTLGDILKMLQGDSESRANAVLIVARRKVPTDLPLLAVSALMRDARTTAMVAHCLARWICDGVAPDDASALLEPLVDDCSAVVARSVTAILKHSPRTPEADRLADLLADHVSATARAEVAHYRQRYQQACG